MRNNSCRAAERAARLAILDVANAENCSDEVRLRARGAWPPSSTGTCWRSGRAIQRHRRAIRWFTSRFAFDRTAPNLGRQYPVYATLRHAHRRRDLAQALARLVKALHS
jgi:hypothetical protein